MTENETCGGRWITTWGNGVYEVRCEKCDVLTATGPAVDRHWARQVYAGTTHQKPSYPSTEGRS